MSDPYGYDGSSVNPDAFKDKPKHSSNWAYNAAKDIRSMVHNYLNGAGIIPEDFVIEAIIKEHVPSLPVASQQVDVRGLAAEVDALYSAEVAGDLWPTLDEVVAVLSESIGVDQSARIRELEQELAQWKELQNQAHDAATEAESELAACKDLWDEVAIVLDEAGIPAAEQSPEGSPNFISTAERVKKLAALSATPVINIDNSAPGQTNVPQMGQPPDCRWPRWWGACATGPCEWSCTTKRGENEHAAEEKLHRHIEECHPEGGGGNVYQVGILARAESGVPLEELAKAMHFWFGIHDGSEAEELRWVWANSDTIKAKWIPSAQAFLARGPQMGVAEQWVDDLSRCAICGWPLADQIEGGCVRGNCSMRPRPEIIYSPERAEKERIKSGPAAPAQPDSSEKQG